MRRHSLWRRLGTVPFEVLPDGRVLVVIPSITLSFGVALRATALYPSLQVFLSMGLRRRNSPR